MEQADMRIDPFYDLAIQLQNILKHTMRSRVRRPKVKRSGLLFYGSFRKFDMVLMMLCHISLFYPLPNI